MEEVRVVSEDILKDSLTLLESAIHAIENKNLVDLEAISNQTIHNASIYQDEVSLSVSIVVLTIFKIEQQANLLSQQLNLTQFTDMLTRLHGYLRSGRVRSYLDASRDYLRELDKIGKQLKLPDVVDKAGLRKGGSLYDHGISLAQAATALNVSQWAMYSYIGRTRLNDYPEDVDEHVKQRLAYARRLFS